MATPPVQAAGSPYQSAWSSAANGARLAPTSGTFAVNTGDKLVVLGATEDNAKTLATPTNAAASSPASITFTLKASSAATGSRCNAYGWEGAVTAGGNVQVSSVHAGGTGGSGIIVFVYSSHNGLGRAATGTAAGSAPSATPSGGAWTANSAVVAVDGDWTATVITSRAYLTNLGTATERNAVQVDGNYSTYAWEHADIGGSPGSGAVGMSAPSQTWTLVAVEVLGTTPAASIPYLVMAPPIPT